MIFLFGVKCMYEDNLEKLKNQCGRNVFRHKININSPLLPFRTDTRDQTDFSRGFKGILGEFSRVSFNKTLNESFNINESIGDIILNTNWDIDKKYEDYLKSFLESYLINDDSEINILHPSLFLYLNKTKQKRTDNEKDIAIFFRDVFFKDITNFNDYFENITEVDNIIVKLILDNIPKLEDEKINQVYYPSLNFIIDAFKEDFEFIKNNYDFVINNLDMVFAYYYFYYCVQLVLKTDQPIDVVDLSKPNQVYYLLDWESASKSRKAINGYGFIKDTLYYFFVNMNLIEMLNTLAGTQGLLCSEIYDLISLGEINKNEYISVLDEWVQHYENMRGLDNYQQSGDFKYIVNTLKSDLKNMGHQQLYAYWRNLNNVALKYFVKRRGKYGYVLNIDKKFLYLITALCVKEEKIKLNDLFKEYERRGLFFDRYSKEEIVNLLNTWNLIDKKSDSGDAQYVKQIL